MLIPSGFEETVTISASKSANNWGANAELAPFAQSNTIFNPVNF